MQNSGDVAHLDLGQPKGREAGYLHPAVVVTAQRILDGDPDQGRRCESDNDEWTFRDGLRTPFRHSFRRSRCYLPSCAGLTFHQSIAPP